MLPTNVVARIYYFLVFVVVFMIIAKDGYILKRILAGNGSLEVRHIALN